MRHHTFPALAVACLTLALGACGYTLAPAALPVQQRAAAAARACPPTANMGERFMRLVKSNVNQAISGLEDPEKVLEQAVDDMQRDLIKVRQAYAEVSASQKRMSEQKKFAEAEAAKWYSRAQLALEKGEDDLAREALSRRQTQLESADSLGSQVDAQASSITSLYESMKELEAKMADAKAKKDQIVARARTAKAATKVNDMLAGVGTSSSVAAFDRMTEKVEQLEAEAAVSKELAATSPSGPMLGASGSSLDAKFKALEGGSSVDDELAAMKRALPGSPVDDELAKMRELMASEDSKKKDK